MAAKSKKKTSKSGNRPATEGTSDSGREQSATGSVGGWPVGWEPLLGDLIATVADPSYDAWVKQVWGVGGCSRPIHLKGVSRLRDPETGRVLWERASKDEPHGEILMRCGNRRASVCPSCSRLYEADTFTLVRAGLAGGKGVPESVAAHPRVFATLTAPSFGAVHGTRVRDGEVRACMPRSGLCEHGRSRGCFRGHSEGDPLLGVPICAECYDYRGAVIWQASVGELWHRLQTYVPRYLARLSGRRITDVRSSLRISFTKITELQRRGVVHLHSVIRADGIVPGLAATGPTDQTSQQGRGPVVRPPDWVSAELLGQAVRMAAGAVAVSVDGGQAGTWRAVWGDQVDVIPISGGEAGAETSPARTAAYLAKYVTKSVADFGPIRAEETPHGTHLLRMMRTAWELGEVPELEPLRLFKSGRELGYRGRVSSRSRQYSTTLTALREARGRYRRQQMSEAEPHLSSSDLIVESFWEVVGFGHSAGQAVIAAGIADQARHQRQIGRHELADRKDADQ